MTADFQFEQNYNHNVSDKEADFTYTATLGGVSSTPFEISQSLI